MSDDPASADAFRWELGLPDLTLPRHKREMYTTDSRICELTNERAVLNEIVESQRNELAHLMERVRILTQERDEARQRTNSILTEIDCRIEHGAESNGHLEAIRSLFKENTND